MTKLLILTVIIVLIYLYWKHQQIKTLPNPDKGKQKEVFFDAQDWELSSDEENN